MDSNEVKKRFVNDVTPPTSVATAPVVEPKSRQTIIVNEPTDEPHIDPLLAPTEYMSHKKAVVASSPEKVIEVPAEPSKTATTDAPPSDSRSDSEIKSASDLDVVPAPEELKEQPVAKEIEAEVVPKEAVEAPAVNPLPETSNSETEPELEVDPEPADKDEPVSDNYEVSDALPDDSTRAANDIKQGMQDPKLYDTTAYHVPIKETHHSHGGVKAALTFGVFFAAAVVGGAIYFMFRLGS